MPKMGLLGSQAGNEKKKMVVNYEQLFRAVFSCFHGQKFKFSKKNLHWRVRTKKLLHTKVKFGKNFFLVKNWFFLGLAVLVIE